MSVHARAGDVKRDRASATVVRIKDCLAQRPCAAVGSIGKVNVVALRVWPSATPKMHKIAILVSMTDRLPKTTGKRASRKWQMRWCIDRRYQLAPFEILHGFFVLFRGSFRFERAQIATLACLRIFLS